MSKSDYNQLSNSNETFICICCIKENLPFSSLSDKNFDIAVIKGVNYLFDELETDLKPLTNAQITAINRFKKAFSHRGTLGEDEFDAVQPPELTNFKNPNLTPGNFLSSISMYTPLSVTLKN